MWKLAQQHKKEIFSHVADVLLCGAFLAASIVSFKHNDLLWGPIIGVVASLILLASAVFLFFLNVAEAEAAFKKQFPNTGRWAIVFIGFAYGIPMVQLFLMVAINGNA